MGEGVQVLNVTLSTSGGGWVGGGGPPPTPPPPPPPNPPQKQAIHRCDRGGGEARGRSLKWRMKGGRVGGVEAEGAESEGKNQRWPSRRGRSEGGGEGRSGWWGLGGRRGEARGRVGGGE